MQHTPEEAPVCGVGESGMKCAVVSWVMPLVATTVLWLALYYPVVMVFNILFLAFGLTALLRSAAHIRRFGGCGLKGHVTVGVILNIAVVTLFVLNVFFGINAF